MSQRRPRMRGLYTNPSAKLTGADGALRVAKNVVVERPGILSPRPGFKVAAVTDAAVAAYRLLPWQDDYLRLNDDATTSWSDTAAPITTDGSTDITWESATYCGSASARKNLYITCSDGVRKLTATDDVVASLAGQITTPIITSVTTPGVSGFCAAGSYVGYAVAVARTDANGLVTRTHGLGHVIVSNGLGVTSDFTLTIRFATGADLTAAIGDVLEVYRTRSNTAIPGREFYLTHSYTVVSGTVGGEYSFTDTTTDANLGAALYTNESREGIQGANMRPPAAADVAEFKGSMFYANTLGPRRHTLRWKNSGNCTGSATGIGYRTINGTRTNGSSTIAMASTTGLEVGMMLTDATNWTSGGPVIIASLVAGVSVTMDTATWGAATDGAPVALTFVDTVRITGGNTGGVTRYEYYPVATDNYNYGYSVGGHQALLDMFNDTRATGPRTQAHEYAYAYAQDVYDRRTAGSGTVGSFTASIVIEERTRGLSAFTIRATKATEWLVDMDSMSESGVTVKADDFPNGLAYSKPEEPEHVPLPYYERIGDETKAILRIIPTRDALWIFKEDGLWRLTGVAAPRWRIDPIDPTLRLLQRDTVARLGDKIYAWTTSGVTEISDSGGIKRGISDPIADKLEKSQRVLSSGNNDAYGHWMAADPVSEYVLLGTHNATDTLRYATSIYCYSAGMGEWTEWEFPWTADTETTSYQSTIHHVVYHEDTARLVASAFFYPNIIEARSLEDAEAATGTPTFLPALYADKVWTANITATAAADGLSSTFTIISGTWTPTVGDVFTYPAAVFGAYVFMITNINGATYTCEPALTVTNTAVTPYDSFDSVIEWQRFGSPDEQSFFRELSVAFENVNGVERVFFESFGDDDRQSAGYYYDLAYVQGDTTDPVAKTIRLPIETNVARSSVQFPRLTITAALAPWSISGATMLSRPYTSRVPR